MVKLYYMVADSDFGLNLEVQKKCALKIALRDILFVLMLCSVLRCSYPIVGLIWWSK